MFCEPRYNTEAGVADGDVRTPSEPRAVVGMPPIHYSVYPAPRPVKSNIVNHLQRNHSCIILLINTFQAPQTYRSFSLIAF